MKLLHRNLNHYETDSDGVCHFSNYLRHAEEGIFTLFGKSEWKTLEDNNIAIVISRIEAKYLSPIRFCDCFSVSLNTIKRNSTKINLTFEVYNETSKHTSCKILLNLAAIDKKANKPISIPENFQVIVDKLIGGVKNAF